MIDREIKKGELAKMASLSSNSISKLAKDENVSLDVLIRVCTALNVDFGDIMELVPDNTDWTFIIKIQRRILALFIPNNFR